MRKIEPESRNKFGKNEIKIGVISTKLGSIIRITTEKRRIEENWASELNRTFKEMMERSNSKYI